MFSIPFLSIVRGVCLLSTFALDYFTLGVDPLGGPSHLPHHYLGPPAPDETSASTDAALCAEVRNSSPPSPHHLTEQSDLVLAFAEDSPPGP